MVPRPLSDLRDKHRGETAYIVGSGPSLDEFPSEKLGDLLTIGLNDVRRFFNPTYWMFGDGRFSRYTAKKIIRDRGRSTIAMNKKHFHFLEKKIPDNSGFEIFLWTNQIDGERQDYSGPWYEGPHDSFIPGRWTIATTALSLSMFLGASKVVMVGIDFGAPEGRYYSERVDEIKPPGRQDAMMGQWRKWLQMGFRKGLWPISIVTVSPHFQTNCPGTPIRTVSIGEALQ